MNNFLLIGIILTALSYGCSPEKEKTSTRVIPKSLGTLITDSVAPPAVTMITEPNAPRVIKANKPTIVPLTNPYGVGVPYTTNYGIADGLPNNNVDASDIDQQGNIWFATSAGISKYDGTGFTNYNSANGMVSGFTRDLLIDSKNMIWIATGEGLSIFDGRHFTKLIIDKDIPGDLSVRKIFEDKTGTIWIATVHGLYKYEDKKFTKYIAADGLADNWISSLIEDKKGNLLISTPKGITSYDGKQFTPYTDIPANKLGRTPVLLLCDTKGNIWFNNGSGELGKYDGKQIKIYSKKERDPSSKMTGNTPTTILEDRKGNIWIGGFREMTKFDGNRFINYSPKYDQESIQVVCLTEDEYGNIWGGTLRNGIYKISNSYLLKMEIPSGLPRGIAIDKSGDKWILSTEGLGKYNSDHIAYYGKDQLGFGAAACFIDHAGNKWFQTFDTSTQSQNIIKYNDTVFTIFEKAQWPSLPIIANIMEDDLKNIWFVGSDGSVVKYDGFSFASYGPAQGLKSNGIYSIFQDRKKNIWFGSRDAGVFKYDGHQFINYNTQDGLPHNFVNDIAEDAFGNIWLATDGGAARFDGKTFTSYGSIDGLGNVIGEVEYDSINKVIWFDTRIGLASLKMGQVNDEKPLFQHYNPRTGFNFSIPNNITIDEQGVVWVRDNGILRFDYKSIKESKPIPAQIKNIKVDNKNISWTSLRKGAYPVDNKDSLAAVNEMALKFGKVYSDEDFGIMADVFGKISYDSVAGSDFIPVNLVLPFKNNNISFEFGSISTSFGKAVQYQYKLEGYDKNWSVLSSKSDASFGNMSEGNYNFLVKALSPFGNWSETSYSFKVLPPWHRAWWAYASYVLLIGMSIFTFIRWRTKALQKEKNVLEEKVIARTAELNQSLENLKATQSQLIQSEKMASLGELTAGIAHEIQNPLNFVNNFSDVNTEIIAEVREAFSSGNLRDAEEMLGTIAENEQKINHHGKRADAIVKGMLQHSRSSSGQKEPTDINALADEYLRLAYHGLRAKDQSFNASFKTDFDQTIGNINIVPQDIGRALLNLINNAFYAVHEKKKQIGDGYDPEVTVTTKLITAPENPSLRESAKSLMISVRDNGNGIPVAIKEKIFQPFFTTKPTGQGTGLGLSLSYDIVKAHGGELKVNTKEGEGSEFIIKLPI